MMASLRTIHQMPEVRQTCVQGIFEEWGSMRMRAETMAPNTPAGPTHLTPFVAMSTLQCPLKVGITQGSPQRVPLRDQDQAWGHRHISREEGRAAKSFHCCREWSCCLWVQHGWQKQAMPAPEQILEGTGNPWIPFEIWIFAFFVSGAIGISWLIRGSLKLISSFRRPLFCPLPSNQVIVTLHIHSCIQLQKSELAKTSVTGAQHHPLSQDLYLL